MKPDKDFVSALEDAIMSSLEQHFLGYSDKTRYQAFYYRKDGMNEKDDCIGAFRDLKTAIDVCLFAHDANTMGKDWSDHEAYVFDQKLNMIHWVS